jgi:hypothetical protein
LGPLHPDTGPGRGLDRPGGKEGLLERGDSGIFRRAEDPKYAVVKVTPYRIEFYSKEQMDMETWEA